MSRKARLNLETVKATLESARADVEAEDDRMKVLDGKLGTLATFAGLSVSISASLGANVLVVGRLSTGFAIGLGVVLTGAVMMLLFTTLTAFRGLRPRKYRGITLETAEARVTPRRLREEPEEALARLASTYYVDLLPAARSANSFKLDCVADAFRYARLGLIGLVVAVVLSALGSVWGGTAADDQDSGHPCKAVGAGAPRSRGNSDRPRPPRSRQCDGAHREGRKGRGEPR